MSKKIYKEKQSFLRPARLRLIIIAMVLLLTGIILRESLNPDYTVKLRDVVLGVAAAGFITLVVVFLVQMRMKLAISNKGVEFKMAPFHKGKRVIPWDDIKRIHVVKTPANAVWQKHYDIYMLQDKFTFTGRNGISLETKDGRTMFIGSSDVNELEKHLREACSRFGLTVTSDEG